MILTAEDLSLPEVNANGTGGSLLVGRTMLQPKLTNNTVMSPGLIRSRP